MKYIIQCLFVASFFLMQISSGYAKALPEFDDAEQMGFSADSKIGDDDLQGMRGGMQIGDILFDFTLIRQTIINGVVQQTTYIQSINDQVLGQVLKLDQNNTQITSTQDLVPVLNTIVQSGANNSVDSEMIANASALLTVIQNSTDNALIQQTNDMNVVVQNLSALQNSNSLQQMNFESINSLR